jgi:hypothetical protein
MPKLSKPLIAALNPTDQDVVVWDSSLPGFGLRAKASGVKTFVIQYRNRSGRSRRLSLGNLGKVTLDTGAQGSGSPDGAGRDRP